YPRRNGYDAGSSARPAAPSGYGNRSPGTVPPGTSRPGIRRFRPAGNGPLLHHSAAVAGAGGIGFRLARSERNPQPQNPRCGNPAAAAKPCEHGTAGRVDENPHGTVPAAGAAPAPYCAAGESGAG